MEYILLLLANTSSGSTAPLREIERGHAMSVGWIGGYQENGEETGVFGMIQPGKKGAVEKKKGLALFGSKKESEESPLAASAQFVFKKIEKDGTCSNLKVSTEAVDAKGWSALSLRGGSLLCVTSCKKEEMKYKSQFYRISSNLERKEEDQNRKKKTEEVLDPFRPKFKLEPVQSAFREVSSVAWSFQEETHYCGVAVDGRVTLLALPSHLKEAALEFKVIKSVEVSKHFPSPALQLFWRANSLVVLEGGKEIRVIKTDLTEEGVSSNVPESPDDEEEEEVNHRPFWVAGVE